MRRTSNTPTILVWRVKLYTPTRRLTVWSAARAEARRAARIWRAQHEDHRASITAHEIALTKRGVLAALRRQAEQEAGHPGHHAVRAI